MWVFSGCFLAEARYFSEHALGPAPLCSLVALRAWRSLWFFFWFFVSFLGAGGGRGASAAGLVGLGASALAAAGLASGSSRPSSLQAAAWASARATRLNLTEPWVDSSSSSRSSSSPAAACASARATALPVLKLAGHWMGSPQKGENSWPDRVRRPV